jgi:hypothetical protein
MGARTQSTPITEREVKEDVARRVHELADSLDWQHLSYAQRRQHYEAWTADPDIGGKLASVMDPSRVRVYLKDVIVKAYARSQRPDVRGFLETLAVDCGMVVREFKKPPALLCENQCLYTLAAAKDWKIAVMGAFERASEIPNLRENIVLITEHTTGRFVDQSYRSFIESAGERLSVEVRWVT